jgi:hypothetical protein
VECGGELLSPVFRFLLHAGVVTYPTSTLPDGTEVDMTMMVAGVRTRPMENGK